MKSLSIRLFLFASDARDWNFLWSIYANGHPAATNLVDGYDYLFADPDSFAGAASEY